MDKKIIGKRIRYLRKKHDKLSQAAFSDKISMDRTYFSKIESGQKNLTIDTLLKICEGLGISIKVFFNFDESDYRD